MLDYKNKYLKYKQKYVNLKKMIGGGKKASYKMNDKETEIILTFFDNEIKEEIKYTIKYNLGKGGNGIIYVIEEEDTGERYILKKNIDETDNTDTLNDEGEKSDMLKGKLNDIELEKDMLVLFQGKEETDFLISKYNGIDLYYEFMRKEKEIKDQYANVTTQLLNLLYTINNQQYFHNDIKLANVTIKDDKVYLIDFATLTNLTSDIGSLISMSFNGVIALLTNYNYTKYDKTFPILKPFLIDTDMVGFFYCCIDLLFLLDKSENPYQSINILNELGIINFENSDDIYRLFELFHFILPTSQRTKLDIDIESAHYNKSLPTEDETKVIFDSFLDDNTNLFRYMAYIYNKIKLLLIKNDIQRIWYKKFLKIMSACFLHDFNYANFRQSFEEIVNEFSKLDVSDSAPVSSKKSFMRRLITMGGIIK
jgi:serine/threonine protein kinase